MIYIEDNFLDEFTFENTLMYLAENEFKKVTAGEKDFWCQFSNDDFDDYVISKKGLVYYCCLITGWGPKRSKY